MDDALLQSNGLQQPLMENQNPLPPISAPTRPEGLPARLPSLPHLAMEGKLDTIAEGATNASVMSNISNNTQQPGVTL